MGCLRIPKDSMAFLFSLGHQAPKLGAGQPMNPHPQRMRGTTTESQKGNSSREGDGYGAEPITQ